MYLDADGKDKHALHLWWETEGRPVAYARLLPPGISYKEASIGRVVSHPHYRNGGYGRSLMLEAIAQTKTVFSVEEIKIGAQLYLKAFYESLGFMQCSQVYDEDGIDHIEMVLKN